MLKLGAVGEDKFVRRPDCHRWRDCHRRSFLVPTVVFTAGDAGAAGCRFFTFQSVS